MSSYRGEAGAWDGGPPGAEADYATQRAPPLAAPMPTTDPWTGVSYSHYGPPQYDYQAYGAHSYGYNYDSSYYQRPDGTYYDTTSTYPPQHSSYDYPRQRERTRSPYDSRSYERRRPSYRSKSRSVSPYDRREREYSRKHDSNYEKSRRHRSKSRNSKTKRTKYSSSDRSSSRSYSRTVKDNKKRRSVSTESSSSTSSYKKVSVSRHKSSLTPPLSKKASKPSRRSASVESVHSSRSRTPKQKFDKAETKSKARYHSNKDDKSKDRRQRDGSTPPRKRCVTPVSPKGQKKSSRTLTTPTKKSKKSMTPPRKHHHHSGSSSMKPKHSSLTPPRCYAREQSTQSSRSRSRSATPKKPKRSRSRRPRSRSSSRSSASSKCSRTRSKRRTKQNVENEKEKKRDWTRERSRSKSRPHKHSANRSRSRSHRRSRSAKPSKPRSRSRGSRSGSRSGTPSEDERRGQFTVADRKRFWKLHKCRQERKGSAKSSPKEVKPPPGAIESSKLDDIEYGDPPEVEGVNFAELLPPPDTITAQASSSKSKPPPIPIKNDGSFLEMFKKLQEETKKTEDVEKKPEMKKPALPFIGKRRGGRVLKTGLVKKAKAIDEQAVDNTPKDAWSLYMQEVKKYRETSCEEERKTRPLVK